MTRHNLLVRTHIAAVLTLAAAGGLTITGCDKKPAAQSATPAAVTPPEPAPDPVDKAIPPGATTRAIDKGANTAGAKDHSIAKFSGLEATIPPHWIWSPPRGTMRAANYVIPAEKGRNAAYFDIFHRIGGSVQANIDRWVGQFRADDSGAVDPQVKVFDVADMSVTFVELAGQWKQMGQATHTPEQLFLMSIVEGPSGRVFVRLAGPAVAVEEQREAYMNVVKSIRVAED